MKFPKLFETVRVGNLTLKNRIIMPPCSTNFAVDGLVTERMKNFYSSIAAGGASMLVIEDAIVDSALGRHGANDLYIDSDRCLPGLTELANCIKAKGAIAAIQINHGGLQAGKVVDGFLKYTNGKLPVAPFEHIAEETGYVVPKELSEDQIIDLVDKFAGAAQRAKKAGFQSVSIHCTHSWLINQFMSPIYNMRQDDYGIDFNGRMKFLLDIVSQTRRRVGPDYPLMCRIGVEEACEGGLTHDDMKEVARLLEKANIDALILSSGIHGIPETADSSFVPVVAPMRVPRGGIADLCAGIKEAVNIPVVAVNRINEPGLAERIIEEGKADLIAMGRPLFADPELPNKAEKDLTDQIRVCIACVWCTHVLDSKDLPVRCAINAQVGMEYIRPLLPAESPKKIMIIGGGPAGMETARVAALRRHDVHLFEKESRLGGQLLAACIPPGKEEIKELVNYLSSEMERLNVTVKTNTPVTKTVLESISPDIIVCATGAKPKKPAIPGSELGSVVTAIDVLSKSVEILGRKVIVVGGGEVGAETAEYLAFHGNKVTVVEMMDEVLPDTPSQTKKLLLKALAEKDVCIIKGAVVEMISPSNVIVKKRQVSETIETDFVVFAVGSEANRNMEDIVAGYTTLWVGDCVQPRNIMNAIHEGYNIGATI